MNKKIKEFMEKAGTDSSGKWMGTDNAEKFAELIVEECVKAADEWYQYHNEIQWDPGEHIKQHFGVE